MQGFDPVTSSEPGANRLLFRAAVGYRSIETKICLSTENVFLHHPASFFCYFIPRRDLQMSAMKRLLAALIAVAGLVIAAASLGAPASAYPAGTSPAISLSATTVPVSSSLTVFGSNFTPNKSATLTLHSTPVGLGTVAVDSKGAFSAQVTIPAGTTPGAHVIEALDVATGDVTSAALTVTASGTGTGTGGGGGLAGTGVAVIGIGALGVVLLVGGGLMLMAGRRRKVTTI